MSTKMKPVTTSTGKLGDERKAHLHLVEASPVEEINREFAIIKTGGILSQEDGEDKFITTSQFRNWLANRDMTADEWLRHPNRREYRKVVFRPKEDTPLDYNLWRGFSFEPSRHGSCEYFLEHILDHVCRGNEDHYNWVMSFFAEIVQRPMQKTGVSLVIRGTSGGGKTIVGKTVGELFPRHYRLVDNPDQVTGKFNAHMSSLLLLHADEAFFAGNPSNAGKLRSMVTRDEHIIEPKGLDSFRVPNYMRLFITSEERWVVPTSLAERRFAIFNIRDDVVNDYKFWKELNHELDNGGRARLLYELMHWDIVDLRNLPQTKALRDQKAQSLTADQAWWVRCLERGYILRHTWLRNLEIAEVLEQYLTEVKDRSANKSTQTSLGIFIREMVPGLIKRRGYYELPTLDECVEHFERKTKLKIVRSQR